MPPRRPDRLRTPVPDPAQENESIRAENPPSGSRQDIGILPEQYGSQTAWISPKQNHTAPGSETSGSETGKCQKKSAPYNTARKKINCECMTNPDASFVGFVQRPVRAARSVIRRFLVLGSECAPHCRTVDLLLRNIVHRDRDPEHGCQCDQVCAYMAIDR